MPVCKKCGKSFPVHVKIDGKDRNLSARKFCLECSPFGKHNTRNLSSVNTKNERLYKDCDESEYECSHCHKILPAAEFYRNGKRIHYLCKACHYEQIKVHRRELKIRAVNYLGGKCIECDYDENYAAMVFHHRDSKDKDFNINDALKWKWERIVKELDKCDLLCCRCHTELHHPELHRKQA